MILDLALLENGLAWSALELPSPVPRSQTTPGHALSSYPVLALEVWIF